MRICYIANAASLHTQRWVSWFAKKGHEVYLLSPDDAGSIKGVQIHILTRLAPPIGSLSKYLSGLSWVKQTRRLVKEIKPDIIDAHYITTYGYLGVISGFHPLVLSAWGSDILITPKRNPVYRFLTKYALKKAEIVIYDSEIVKKGLLEMGTNPSKIRKIFWGVDTLEFNPKRGDEALRSRLEMLGAPIIICIRNLLRTYNVEMLIKAVPLVLSQVPKAKFIIGGDGDQKDYLKNLANSLGVSDSTRFTGYIPHDKLPQYLASSDVYVSTSLTDSTSLSLQEAMACELAPIVTDLPANREWITDGESGFVIPINDIQTLAQKIIYLLGNDEIRRRFGRLGREIIQERAEYEREMARMEKMYQELVSK